MPSSQNSLVKQAKVKEPQAFQSWNNRVSPSEEVMKSSLDNPAHLKSQEFQYNPNQKLMAIQKMADDSPNNQKFIQLKSLATPINQQRQPPLQLKKNNSGLPDTL